MTSPLAGKLAASIYKGMKGLFLDATLTRDGVNSGQGYSPNLAEPTVYTCKAIAQPSKGAQGTDIVSATDTTILILRNSLSVSPEPLDRIAIASQGISGVIPSDPKAVKSDPAAATWECRVVT
jgi:hypothetical protein